MYPNKIFDGIDITQCLIIDNMPSCFYMNVENGIPIVPFIGDVNDTELKKLEKYINVIYNEKDYRICNKLMFGLSRIKLSQTFTEAVISYTELFERFK